MYKVYIISLINTGSGEHLKSAQEWLPQTIGSCNHYNWQTNIFPAVNGYHLRESDWENFGLSQPKKSKNKEKKFIGDLPGAQGCFLSHYKLWNTCIAIDQPIVILEDDAIAISPLSHINLDYDLVKLHSPQGEGQSKLGHWSTGAFAYWLSPPKPPPNNSPSFAIGSINVDIIKPAFKAACATSTGVNFTFFFGSNFFVLSSHSYSVNVIFAIA